MNTSMTPTPVQSRKTSPLASLAQLPSSLYTEGWYCMHCTLMFIASSFTPSPEVSKEKLAMSISQPVFWTVQMLRLIAPFFFSKSNDCSGFLIFLFTFLIACAGWVPIKKEQRDPTFTQASVDQSGADIHGCSQQLPETLWPKPWVANKGTIQM